MIKQLFWMSIISSVILSTGCTGEEGKDDNGLNVKYEDESNELYEFEAFSLAPYGLNALIYLPDATANIGAATEPRVEHEANHYQWDLYVGQNFHMRIEDWGDDNALKTHIANLEDHAHIYQIDYIENTDDFIYYKSTLKVDGEVPEGNVGTEHVTYHVVAQHKIDGINYIFRTNKEGHPKPITDYMAKSVKSVTQIEDPS